MDDHYFSDLPTSESDIEEPSISSLENQQSTEESVLHECSCKMIHKVSSKYPSISFSVVKEITEYAKEIFFYEAYAKINETQKMVHSLSERESIRVSKLLHNASFRRDALKVFRKHINNPLCFKHNLTGQECVNFMIDYYKGRDGINDEIILQSYFSNLPTIKKEIFSAYKEFLRDLKKRLTGKPRGSYPSNSKIEIFTRSLFPAYILEVKTTKCLSKETLFGLVALLRKGRDMALQHESSPFWSIVDDNLSIYAGLQEKERKVYLSLVLEEDRNKYTEVNE